MVHLNQGWTDQFSGFSGNLIVLPIWYVPYWFSTSTFFYPRCLELGKKILEDNWRYYWVYVCYLSKSPVGSSTSRTVPYACSSPTLPTLTGKSLPQNLLEVDTIGPCKRSFWEAPIPSHRPWCDRQLDADWAIGRFGENGHAARADGGKGAVFFIQDLFAWIL